MSRKNKGGSPKPKTTLGDTGNVITITSIESNDLHTASIVSLNEKTLCVSIEDPLRDIKIVGRTGIPNGDYKCGLTGKEGYSDRWFRDNHGNIIHADDRKTDALKAEYSTEHEMIEIIDVPGFEKVCFGWGNTVNDTEGDVIVGERFGNFKSQKGVLSSRKTYQKIYPLLWSAVKGGGLKASFNR